MMKQTQFEKLFSPLKIGKKVVKNRIVSTAHATGWDMNGLLSERHIRYHERKAKGGAGLIMTFGSASVLKESAASYGSISLWDERNEPALKDFAKRVHAHDALLIAQATHMGRRGTSALTGNPVFAPSSIPEGVHNEIPHVMRTDEISTIVQAFVDIAKRLERCGWDGIEVTSFGGHLIEQFWSPTLNLRTDKYGGDFEGRMRFSIEVIEAVRAAVSDDFILSFRMVGDPMTDVLGLDQRDMLKIAKRLDQLSCIDLFNINGGTGATYKAQSIVVPGDTFEVGLFNDLASMMKKELSVPVLVAGRVFNALEAEELLQQGKSDLVGLTRAIIADPDLPGLSQKGECAKVRPCIACNEGCIGRLYSGMPMICTVNPAIADDSLDAISRSNKKQKIIVIGGGPAGLEASRVSAMRGHEVILLEQANNLGGKVLLASVTNERPHYDLHVRWLVEELSKLEVKVYKNFHATVKNIVEFNPDTIILAIGSSSFVPFANERKDKMNIVTDEEVLSGKVKLQSYTKVVVYDREAAYRGGSVAVHLAKRENLPVEIATPHWSVSDKLDDMRKAEMYRLLAKNKIVQVPNKELIVNDEEIVVLKEMWSGDERKIEEDELIVLVGFEEGDNEFYEAIKNKLPKTNLYQIGDSISPRRLHDAIREGAKVASKL